MTEATDPFQSAREAHQAGDFRRAEEGYRKLLRSDPKCSKVWLALGNLCDAQGRLVEAAACIQQAVECAPREGINHIELGNVLLRQGKYAEAETAYRRGLEILPNHLEALVNLGFVLGEQDRADEALVCYERARALAPHVPEVHHNLGNILRDKGKLDDALASYDEALRLRPEYAKAHINKGIALASRGSVGEALVSMRRGVELNPDFAEARNSLGTVLMAEGLLDDAVAEYERAIALKPDYPDARWNLSLHQLLCGDYERGWAEYEWRWRCPKTTPLPAQSQPRWDGAPLAGRTILVHAEQGLGDTLHFVRYAPLLKALGGRVILQCQGVLIPLLRRCSGIDEFVAWRAPSPACDVWSPLMSLPALFHTALSTIPAEIPYLFADPERVDRWRRELAPLSGFRIGIAWQGSPRHAWDRHRSVPLSAFEPLARIPGVRLISLQKHHGAEQVRELKSVLPLMEFDDSLDRDGAFTDTAAIIQNLDLVVTADSAVAHLAGGLGAPVWLALHHIPDWRWLLGRSDNPWYPTARLFRQPAVGAWGPVFRQIADELPALVARSLAGRPLLVEVSAGELLDKLAILQIKSERIADPDKLRNIRLEMESLAAVRATLESSPALAELEQKLKGVNEHLWDIEDEIRVYEQRQDFGPEFIACARSVYRENDRRAAIKRAINDLLQSRLVEEKSYAGKVADALPPKPGECQSSG
jgi:tetratricopeptide (TPR) repeat protein